MSNHTRNLSIDFLRGLIIISALVLHFNQSIGLGILSLPSLYIQKYFVTVGGFFFFTAGYFAQKIYYPRFTEKKLKTSVQIIKKGIYILAVYYLYILSMHIVTSTPIANGFYAFTFEHGFYTKILFYFGALYVLSPLFLHIFSKSLYIYALTIGAILSMFFLHNYVFKLNYNVTAMLFDGTYALAPSIIIYSGGFLFALLDKEKSSKNRRTQFYVAMALIMLHTVLFIFIPNYSSFLKVMKFYVLFQALSSMLLYLIVNYLLSNGRVKRIFEKPYITCLGTKSLTFYVFSNLFLSLLNVSQNSSDFTKGFAFVFVFTLAYTFTFWQFSASKR